LGRLPGDVRGATSLEFAICGVAFLCMTLGLMDVGYDLFIQAELDTATEMAARTVQVGGVTGTTGQTSAQLAAAAVCPNLHGLLNCSLVIVSVAPLTTGDYSVASNYQSISGAAGSGGYGATGGSNNTGCAGQMMLLQAWYVGPTFVGRLIPAFSQTYFGKSSHITASSAGFVNEYFAGGQACTGA
jgi:Flp pilus assembly protein TadG